MPESEPQQKKILIVEVDDDQRRLLQEALEGGGYMVAAVAGAQHALLYADWFKPYLILLDIILVGHVDGWEVLRRLKASAETTAIPVLIVSASGDEAQVDRARAAGAYDYLMEPYQPAELLLRVAGILASHALTAEMAEEEMAEEEIAGGKATIVQEERFHQKSRLRGIERRGTQRRGTQSWGTERRRIERRRIERRRIERRRIDNAEVT